MGTSVTLVLAYYENPQMLQKQYASLRELDPKLRDRIHLIVVDDGSPEHPAVVGDAGVPLQIYRMDKDVRWNQDACRNIGVHHAETNWVLLTDMDHLVPAATWAKVINGDWDARIAYTFRRVSAPDNEPYKPHPNSWLLSRQLYWDAGGYDERFAGLYGTDGDFRNRLLERAKGTMQFKEPLVRVPRVVIPDASTTTYLRKQPEDRVGLARVKAERGDKYKPLNLTFDYKRVA